ncbi:transcriptional regulator [Gracilibacillus boraciitolerans JCM 21714]|uniref:Transcriptional regulator n=1 Tax=Gracilibacillus boraciitolerans JCM 21714 TaxID=1298598 RepID=W4VFD5_9BACI|nr:AraC family transcriptional regulator [Gracilibacillus boraciitolerans]GAE91459.1 transcriptional regulator [Gracilibacillus boraciitolerans JCM 21714]
MDAILHEKLLEETEEERAILEGDQAINKKIYTNRTSDFVIQSDKFLKDDLIMIRKHPRYINFPKHSHDYIEMNYVFHGTFHQKVAKQPIHLKKGDILLLNQYIEHELSACSEEDIVINFIIHPAFFDYILSNLSTGFIQSQMLQFLMNSMFDYNQTGQFLYYPVANSKRIQAIMNDLLKEMMFDSILSQSKIKFQMGLLILELIEEQNLTQEDTLQTSQHAFLTEVFRYIEEHYQDANLQSLAKQCHQTAYWISKQIKALTKQNFKDLVQEKRLLVAKNLLIYSDLSMRAIAEEVGYENISYFYRLFKQKYGNTPKAYKKQLIES